MHDRTSPLFYLRYMKRYQCRKKCAAQEEEPTAASNICGRVVGLHRNSMSSLATMVPTGVL